MRRIYITGCPFSGTALMNRLFYAFQDVEVLNNEISLDDFLKVRSNSPILVGKRTAHTIFSHILRLGEMRRQIQLLVEYGVEILYMSRWGWDVVRTRGEESNRCSSKRWIACQQDARRHSSLISLSVRYEFLISNPEVVQHRIEEIFRLKSAHPFLAYPDFVPPEVFDLPPYRDSPAHHPRPLDDHSIHVGIVGGVRHSRKSVQAEFERECDRYEGELNESLPEGPVRG